MTKKQMKIPEAKEKFVERMELLLPDEKDRQSYWEVLKKTPVRSIRCNTLKISSEKLKLQLENNYNWTIEQPWKENPEVMIVLSELNPGELGRTMEHLLGYYYIQELASLFPIISLRPEKEELFLDLCAAPGSKTTQASAFMQNKGTIIANEVSLGRLKILSSNLERCGATNTLVTKKDGPAFCRRIKKEFPDMKFDKILIDAPCSGEGTLRSSYKTYRMWNFKSIKNLSKIQKLMVAEAIKILTIGGELVYSTCTHAPEENEEVVDFILKNFPEMEIQEVNLPKEIKKREGISKWNGKEFHEGVRNSSRIYPQDNNTEGFFISKFKKGEIRK